jgi:hypothetical protein
MRASWLAVVVLVGCGQKADHPSFAPACEGKGCVTPPITGSGSGNEAGASSGGGGDELLTVNGNVITYADDFFDQGTVLTGAATISAVGRNGVRVSANYDGSAFTLDGVAKMAANWFMVEPQGTGLLPTLTPVDTRESKADVLGVGLAQNLTIDGIFSLMGTERSAERAQIVLHVVDSTGASVAGVKATYGTAERIGYRTAGTWLANDEGTDDTGLMLIGNAEAGSTVTSTTVALSGTTSARAQVMIEAGAVSIASVIVAKK